MEITVSEVRRHPVKSLRGETLSEATVEPWGLAGDRRWMLVDPGGEAITARTERSLLRLVPTLLHGGGLRVDADALPGGMPVLEVPRPEPRTPAAVTVHGKPLRALDAGRHAEGWWTRLLARPTRLVYLDDPTGRPTNPAFTRAEDRVSFADGYPLLLCTETSLRALDDLVAEADQERRDPLSMTRFRPNLVVAGSPAWAEDGWRRLRVGAADFRVVKGCDRCVMTTIDPETTETGREPLATLARHRRWDGLTWFGVQLVTDTPGAVVRPGDPVEVLEAVPDPDGPPR